MRILAIGAHPDDVEIGCGGMFLDSVKCEKGMAICSAGAAAGVAEERAAEVRTAYDMMGAEFLREGPFLDSFIRLDGALVGFIEQVAEEFEPDLVLTHWPNDTHQDHTVVARAVLAAMRKGGQLAYFESLSSVDFCPTMFREVKDYEGKKDLLGVHESQNAREVIAGMKLAEYTDAMMKMRGLQSRVFKYAEAFVPARLMINWG